MSLRVAPLIVTSEQPISPSVASSSHGSSSSRGPLRLVIASTLRWIGVALTACASSRR